jgi:hypothetical protein
VIKNKKSIPNLEKLPDGREEDIFRIIFVLMMKNGMESLKVTEGLLGCGHRRSPKVYGGQRPPVERGSASKKKLSLKAWMIHQRSEGCSPEEVVVTWMATPKVRGAPPRRRS